MINRVVDGVLIIDENHIATDDGGNALLWEAATGVIPGVIHHSGNFLTGPETHTHAVGEIWVHYEPFLHNGELHATQRGTAPSYGPAWIGQPYIPSPAEVREYCRTGKMPERNWCTP